MAAKKHTFDIGTLSSAIDKITMQGSKVFINFSGNEKVMSMSGNLQTAHFYPNSKVLSRTLKVYHLDDFIMIPSKMGI